MFIQHQLISLLDVPSLIPARIVVPVVTITLTDHSAHVLIIGLELLVRLAQLDTQAPTAKSVTKIITRLTPKLRVPPILVYPIFMVPITHSSDVIRSIPVCKAELAPMTQLTDLSVLVLLDMLVLPAKLVTLDITRLTVRR